MSTGTASASSNSTVRPEAAAAQARGVALKSGLLLALGLLGSVAGAQSVEPITVHFHVRPPYTVAQADGSPTGITGNPVRQAFATSGLGVRWQETPASRQLVVIEGNTGRDCGIGWFKNPQRERFARFSAPIYRDLPWAVITSRNFRLGGNASLAQVLAATDMRLLVKDKYSYGAELDRKIAQFGGEVVTTTGDWAQIIGLLSLARADFMFTSHEEAVYVVNSEKGLASGLKLLTISDAPPGEFRYLMCSKQVSEAEMQALNAALANPRPGL